MIQRFPTLLAHAVREVAAKATGSTDAGQLHWLADMIEARPADPRPSVLGLVLLISDLDGVGTVLITALRSDLSLDNTGA